MSVRGHAVRRRRASTRSHAPSAHRADSPVEDEPEGGGVGLMGYLRAVFNVDDDSEVEAAGEMASEEPPPRRRRDARRDPG